MSMKVYYWGLFFTEKIGMTSIMEVVKKGNLEISVLDYYHGNGFLFSIICSSGILPEDRHLYFYPKYPMEMIKTMNEVKS